MKDCLTDILPNHRDAKGRHSVFIVFEDPCRKHGGIESDAWVQRVGSG